MVLVASKLAFAHLPKTGGKTIRSILSEVDETCREVGDYHSKPAILNSYGLSIKVFISVRHPITWYRSRWHHRIRHGWLPAHPVDWQCANNDFNKFVNNVIEYDADGRLSTLIKLFMKKNNHDNVDYIIKNESLYQDLYDVLLSSGYSNLDDYKSYCNPTNVSGFGEESSNNVAIYNDSTMNRLLEHERWVIHNFYNQSQNP